MARTGKAPTSGPPEVLAAYRVSVTSPRTGLASGKLPTRLRSLPCAPTGPISYYPSRAGVPSTTFASTFRTLPNILCSLLKQVPQSTKTLINSFTLFRISNHSVHCSSTTLYIAPDNYRKHMYTLKHLPDEYTITPIDHIRPLLLSLISLYLEKNLL